LIDLVHIDRIQINSVRADPMQIDLIPTAREQAWSNPSQQLLQDIAAVTRNTQTGVH
jgi:hypothetical protein